MSSLWMEIKGFGFIEVPHPKGVNVAEFDQIVSDAVLNAVQLVYHKDPGFHPAMGLGGHSWDHENQRHIPTQPEPEIVIIPSRKQKILASVKKAFGRA